MKKYIVIVGVVILIAFIYLSGEKILEVTNAEVKVKKEVDIVIDPGHGGEDPGKIGINKAKEKEINLVIALKVKELLESKGYVVCMTRTSDESNGMSKVEDLQNRVDIINEYIPKIAVSIHQNSYEEESISGAQVFYYTHSLDGEKSAVIMQEALLEVDPENHRKAKENDTYYLLEKTQVPTIIVECGFLSNQKEADLLIDESYQEKMATVIVKGMETILLNL